MRAIILWLLRLLERSLDPDLQARIDAYNLKVKAAEAEETRLLAEIEASRITLAELSQVLTDNQRKEIELDNAILHSKAELQRRIDERARLSDMDKLELDV